MVEILLFIITRPILATWWARALIVAVAASAVLNVSPFLPWLKDIKPSRIIARLVGYTGLTLALAIWTAFYGDWIMFWAWVIIAAATLAPNVLVHLRAESTGGGGTVIEFKMTDEGKTLLERYLGEYAPGDPELARLFKLEQQRETAQERWEDALMPKKLLGLLDEATVCIAKAVTEDNENWLYTAVAHVREVRDTVRKAKHHVHLWYRLFWPEHAA